MEQFAVCNVGSSCREEYARANGSDAEMWVDEGGSIARMRLNSERNRVRLNEYQPAVVPKFTEVSPSIRLVEPCAVLGACEPEQRVPTRTRCRFAGRGKLLGWMAVLGMPRRGKFLECLGGAAPGRGQI